MLSTTNRLTLLVCLLYGLAGCGSNKYLPAADKPAGISAIHFIGGYDIPYNYNYRNTTVGGLSGIDYDTKRDQYYMISDDRSDHAPARFYTAKIGFTAKGIDTVYFISVTSLLQPNGQVYPNKEQDKYHVPDPEAMRYNPLTRQFTWSSEGERIVRQGDTVLENPAVTIIDRDGRYKSNYTLPPNLLMQAIEKGPRQNGVFEGLAFTDRYKNLYVSVEEPLYEDGPRAGLEENNAWVRILKFDVATKQNTQQFAYKLSPVAYPANPATAFKINGIPDILALGDNKFLVIERSFSTGRMACTIKVFIADFTNATDVKNIPSLKNAVFTPVTKKLLLNMDDLGIYIDNIEGVTFGPLLPNGHRSLLFIADNNFNVEERSQVLLFEVE